jgi:hypothetical protein
MDDIVPVKNWSAGVSGGPRMVDIDAECGIVTSKSQVESQAS